MTTLPKFYRQKISPKRNAHRQNIVYYGINSFQQYTFATGVLDVLFQRPIICAILFKISCQKANIVRFCGTIIT